MTGLGRYSEPQRRCSGEVGNDWGILYGAGANQRLFLLVLKGRRPRGEDGRLSEWWVGRDLLARRPCQGFRHGTFH
jgi:hypothetical protein